VLGTTVAPVSQAKKRINSRHPSNHVLDRGAVHIGATPRIRWIEFCGCRDAALCYYCCSNLFIIVSFCAATVLAVCRSTTVHAGARGAQALQIVARPPNLAVLLTHCGELIFRKISKFDATRCQILRLKCTKFDFRWGFAPDPARGAYSSPVSRAPQHPQLRGAANLSGGRKQKTRLTEGRLQTTN